MRYSYSKDIKFNFLDTEKKVKDALFDVGFGVLTEINMKEAFKMKDRLVFMDFITDQEENVWPMVQTGKGLTDMLLGSEDL